MERRPGGKLRWNVVRVRADDRIVRDSPLTLHQTAPVRPPSRHSRTRRARENQYRQSRQSSNPTSHERIRSSVCNITLPSPTSQRIPRSHCLSKSGRPRRRHTGCMLYGGATSHRCSLHDVSKHDPGTWNVPTLTPQCTPCSTLAGTLSFPYRAQGQLTRRLI